MSLTSAVFFRAGTELKVEAGDPLGTLATILSKPDVCSHRILIVTNGFPEADLPTNQKHLQRAIALMEFFRQWGIEKNRLGVSNYGRGPQPGETLSVGSVPRVSGESAVNIYLLGDDVPIIGWNAPQVPVYREIALQTHVEWDIIVRGDPAPGGRPTCLCKSFPTVSSVRSRAMRQISILIGLLFVSLLYSVGCHEPDQITRYRVPKQKIAAAQVTQEMLIALTQRDGEVYFFKTIGPTDRIDRHREQVRTFLQQLQFPSAGNSSPTWKLPPTWSERKGSGMRIATITVDKPPEALELVVSSLRQTNPNWNAYLASNLNRWRGQMGLPSMEEKKAVQAFETLTADGQTIYLAQIKGTQAPPPQRSLGGFGQPSATTTGFDATRVRGTPPPEWKPGPVTGMRKACFRMQSDGQSLEVTVITAGGNLLANVNRWRGQLELSPINEEQLEKSIVDVKAGNADGKYVALFGSLETILVAVFPSTGGGSWFVKLRGNQDLVKNQAAAFKTFITSLRFGPNFQ
jgi:hypothetical protein